MTEPASEPTARAVRFDRYGGTDVYHLADIPMPVAGPGQVVVAVRAAGINPGEIAIRSGAMDDAFPATFPSGQGSDLAGVVTTVGGGVDDVRIGDEVLGFSWERSSHATHVAIPSSQLIHKPAALSWEVAGSLYVVGCTAVAAVRAVQPVTDETVVVSAAAGGVGTVVVQLLGVRGVRVIGIASPSNHQWLAAHGAIPVAYGGGLADRVREVAPDGVDAFIDLFGPEYLDLAVDLGVPSGRIETIISFQRAAELGARADGSGTASTPEALTEVADLVASGAVEVPIAATFPLDRVAEAFDQLANRHTRGKIVLIP